MTDEDLIRVFNYIGVFKGVLCWTRGPGKRKTHYLQFLAHMQFEGKRSKKCEIKDCIQKMGQKIVSRGFYDRAQYNIISPEGRWSFKRQPSKWHLLWFYKEYFKVQGHKKLCCNYPFL